MKRVYLNPVGLFALAICALLWQSCEREFIPDIIPASDIVVEGYIEAGDQPTPPYVILTRSFPFFRELDAAAINNNFVHDAIVTVSDGDKEVTLQEVCLNELTPAQRALAAQLLGLNLDSIGFNICLYIDISFSMMGQEGKNYDLRIEVEGKTLSANTSIPFAAPPDSLWFVPPPGEPTDTLAQMRCKFSDPPGPNFYRYFTKINSEPFQAPISSVTDDLLFDGQSFIFPLTKAESRTAEFDPATFGLFHVGDTVSVRWLNIDKAHFDFWNTLEFNAVNQGPFSSYTRVAHNINGGLGIWGGLVASTHTLVVNPE